jgi:hypothetical protein
MKTFKETGKKRKEHCEFTFEPHCGLFEGRTKEGHLESVLTGMDDICYVCGFKVEEHTLTCHFHPATCFDEVIIDEYNVGIWDRLFGNVRLVKTKFVAKQLK